MNDGMPNSTHRVEVVRIGSLQKHPNADTLVTSTIFDGYPVVMKEGLWAEGDLAAYVPPDSMIDVTRPEFASFADPKHPERVSIRIRTKKLRGIFSMGLLIPAPAGAAEGDDVAEQLGVTHYEPPVRSGKNGSRPGGSLAPADVAPPPPFSPAAYDLEAFRRYGKAFHAGEPVVITEKIHGANARYTWQDGRLHAGSRNQWKARGTADQIDRLRRVAEQRGYLYYEIPRIWSKEGSPEIAGADTTIGGWAFWDSAGNHYPMDGEEAALRKLLNIPPSRPPDWWAVVDRYPGIARFCEANPGLILYGEVFGPVQDMHYGQPNAADFMAFDVMEGGGWWSADTFHVVMADYGIPVVPVLYRGPFVDIAHVLALAEGMSTVPGADHVREGCVVRPEWERFDGCGRVHLKAVGNGYLERP